jgi:hypothetical protein
MLEKETEEAIIGVLNKLLEEKPEAPKKRKALTLPEFGDAVVKIAAAVVTLSGLCYLFGFSIYNVHSSQFGVVSYELSASTYFLAGLSFMALFLMPLAAILLLPSAIDIVIWSKDSPARRPPCVVTFIIYLALMVVIAAIAILSLRYAMGTADWNSSLDTLLLFFGTAALFSAGQGARLRAFRWVRDISDGWSQFVIGTMLATLFGLGMAYAVPVWAKGVYRGIDHAFGGADLGGAQVRVLFSTDADTGGPALLAALEADFGIVPEKGGFTPPLRLMEDGPTALFVFLGPEESPHALRLPRAAVAGAVFSVAY